MLNTINLIGRWTRDTEIIMAGNGTEILNGSLAVSDAFNKDHTDFIEIKAFKQLALNTNKFTSKGSKVAIVGKLQHERWEKDGQKRSKHVVIANQIVFLMTNNNLARNNLKNKKKIRLKITVNQLISQMTCCLFKKWGGNNGISNRRGLRNCC